MLMAIQTGMAPHNAWDTFVGIGIIVLLIAVLWLVNRIVIHYFPSTGKMRTAGGNALMRVEAIFLPGPEHVLEALERDDETEDEQGDPPHTGGKIEHR